MEPDLGSRLGDPQLLRDLGVGPVPRVAENDDLTEASRQRSDRSPDAGGQLTVEHPRLGIVLRQVVPQHLVLDTDLLA